MADNELISIIVPVYNAGKYIRRCLNSLINQTYRNIEIIIIDDGSTDKSALICKSFAAIDSRIRCYLLPHSGISCARNAGLSHANGVYLSFVDADDHIQKSMIETLYKTSKEKHSDITICGYFNSLGHLNFRCKPNDGTIEEPTKEEAVSYLCGDKKIQSFLWNKLFLKSLWDGMKFEEGRLYEDVYMITDLFFKATKIVIVNKDLYYYVIHINSASRHYSYQLYVDRFLCWYYRYCDPRIQTMDKAKKSLLVRKFSNFFVISALPKHYQIELDDKMKYIANEVKRTEAYKEFNFVNRYRYELYCFSPRLYGLLLPFSF